MEEPKNLPQQASHLKEFDQPNFKNATYRLDRPSMYLINRARKDELTGYDKLQNSMTSSTVYIGHLVLSTTEEQIYELFCRDRDRDGDRDQYQVRQGYQGYQGQYASQYQGQYDAPYAGGNPGSFNFAANDAGQQYAGTQYASQYPPQQYGGEQYGGDQYGGQYGNPNTQYADQYQPAYDNTAPDAPSQQYQQHDGSGNPYNGY
ncbi:hypothetical protein PMKS-002839 [Pichia membranifaciens]|uniref:Uncharacterized protein n=1 Tax=Pichia membranifaciens TaxID=4926 RepID=A0A1Q2YII2_9ASCO|nr:hypothetical protein PMKS-002839 [Pichia membranifaciens]